MTEGVSSVNKITAASTLPHAASEAGPDTECPPSPNPVPPTEHTGLPISQESYPGESGNSIPEYPEVIQSTSLAERRKAQELLAAAATTANRPRDQQATMQTDWDWILKALRMCQDRALTGTPLHLRHPAWLPPSADCAMTLRNSVVRMIDDIFSTAVVEREDAAESAP
jgi:hypothetical protein